MDGLPMFPLFYWAWRAPVFVICRDVYLTMMVPRARELKAFLEWNGQKYGLRRVQTLDEMASDYFNQNAAAIERWQAHAWRERGKTAATLLELAEVRQLETAVFLCHRLVPHLQRMHGETVTPLPLSQKPVAQLQQRLKQHIQQVNPSQPSCWDPLWPVLPAVEGWGFLEGNLVHLTPEQQKRAKTPHLMLPDASYAVDVQPTLMKVMTTEFHDRLKNLLMQHAERDLPQLAALTEEVQRAFTRCDDLVRGLRTDLEGRALLYDNPPWRVFHWHGHWYVGLRVEPYALEDKDGNLYALDGTTVVVRAVAEGSLPPAEVLSPRYEHPFLPSDGRSICMGNYFDRAFLTLRELPPEERLLQYLMDARQTLMGGYHQHNLLTPYHHLDAFPHRRITRQQANARKLPVYPYYRRSST